MDVFQTAFAGVYEVRAPRFVDSRGIFRKVFHAVDIGASVDDFVVREVYYSTSRHGAIRGPHFQVPPFDQHKLNFCLKGRMFDVCVDLRRSSSTYGRHLTFEINEDEERGILVPKGFAHGFQAMADDTVVVSISSQIYAPSHERGVAWDSCGIDWPCETPVLSDKDRSQPPLAELANYFA